ncbi:acyl-CoA thioesterase [Roseibium aggregatum]|uniref:Acyl-CoA thioesterase n=1 Tax=Roseibium aggregatum TaxID=187304 RepID=A0A939J3J6_9HYPH|nr:thioesterase family protein [Roseibium aggregatum]MBN9670662.1 acyl-CoA thioesterase [Roseibium aggregatum]
MTVLPEGFAAVSDFPVSAKDTIRYGDTDRQGHVNNAVFSTFLETGRVDFLYRENLTETGAAFVIARLELDFLGEINWPGDVEIGTAVLEVGRSSFKLYQKVFQNGVAVAQAVNVCVQMNEETRKSQPLSEKARQRLKELTRHAPAT